MNKIFLLILAITYGALASENRVVLPIDEEQSLFLCIEMPQEEFKAISAQNSSVFLFVPVDADEHSLEKIKIECFRNQRYTPQGLLDSFKQGCKENQADFHFENFKVIYQDTGNNKKYGTTILAVSFYANNQKILLFFQFFSGPHDASGFIYTMKISGNESDEEALKKIQEFIKKNVSIGKF